MTVDTGWICPVFTLLWLNVTIIMENDVIDSGTAVVDGISGLCPSTRGWDLNIRVSEGHNPGPSR